MDVTRVYNIFFIYLRAPSYQEHLGQRYPFLDSTLSINKKCIMKDLKVYGFMFFRKMRSRIQQRACTKNMYNTFF